MLCTCTHSTHRDKPNEYINKSVALHQQTLACLPARPLATTPLEEERGGRRDWGGEGGGELYQLCCEGACVCARIQHTHCTWHIDGLAAKVATEEHLLGNVHGGVQLLSLNVIVHSVW